MKGYFLLKKRKIIHKGKTKVIEQSFNNINKDIIWKLIKNQT